MDSDLIHRTIISLKSRLYQLGNLKVV